MDVNWEVFKFKFLDFIVGVTSFNEFYRKMCQLPDNDSKGIYFEYFAKLYFYLLPMTRGRFTDYVHWNDISIEFKNQLNLPIDDKGIDAVVKWGSQPCSVQVKFRADMSKIIPYHDISTFMGLTYGINNYFYKGIFFTNCLDVCEELKNDKYICITYEALQKCDNLFWENVREYIGEKPITRYVPMKPLPFQDKIVEEITEYYFENRFGRLSLPCGTGKTFLGFWTAKHILMSKKVFIVVPSLYLLSETYETWQRELQFQNTHFILIGSDMDTKGEIFEYRPTTNLEIIKHDIQNYDDLVVITTYHSSNLLLEACQQTGVRFDLAIYDEAHRTAGNADQQFTCLLTDDISEKRLFMTATEKIHRSNSVNRKVFSMDDKSVYGDVIYFYSVRQAIIDTLGKPYGLVDYQIVCSIMTHNRFTNMINDQEIIKFANKMYGIDTLVTAITVIESMEEYGFTHLLIFSNTNQKAKDVLDAIQFIFRHQTISKYEKLTFGQNCEESRKCTIKILEYMNMDFNNGIYCKHLTGHDSMDIRKSEVIQFEQAERGIISSARIFGEGVNIPICDAVCFADNKRSSVDIGQCVGRCLRKCSEKPNKKSYVLVPLIWDEETDFLSDENSSFKKIRQILKCMGQTDEMIMEHFILRTCKPIGQSRKSNTDQIVEYGEEIDINKFREHIATKVFDSQGNLEDRWRNMLICENRKRMVEGAELIDTKRKCVEYLQKVNCQDIPKVDNWIKYSLGNDLYDKIESQYYHSDEIVEVCERLEIYDLDDYDRKCNEDNRLPPVEYIDSGLYKGFNLSLLLNEIAGDCDY